MDAKSIVRNCEGYLSGFSDVKDVCTHKSGSQFLLGIVKIVSYCLLIPPIVCAALGAKYRKIVQIEDHLDQQLDTGALSAQVVWSRNAVGAQYTPKEFVSYLVEKVANLQVQHTKELGALIPQDEKNRFQKGFRLLDAEGQKEFFKEIFSQQELRHKLITLKLIPNDIKELHFCLGDGSLQSVSASKTEDVDRFVAQLKDFRALEVVKLDLRGLGFMTPSLNGYLASNGREYHDGTHEEGIINWGGVSYSQYTNSGIMCLVMQNFRELLRDNPIREFDFRLMNVSASLEGERYGTGGTGGVYRNEEPNFQNTLLAYLQAAR